MLHRRSREVTKEEQECLAKAGVAGGRFQPQGKAQGQIGQRLNDGAQGMGDNTVGVCGLFQTSAPIKGHGYAGKWPAGASVLGQE